MSEHTPATDNLGPHLLGRKSHPAELGDASLEEHLSASGAPSVAVLVTYLNDAIAALEPFAFVPVVARIVPILKEVSALLSQYEGARETSLARVIDEVIAELAQFQGTPLVSSVIGLLEDVLAAMGDKPAPIPPPSSAPPTSPPPSPSPSTSRVWADPVVLDQGQTGHCVGFGGSGFLASDPVEDQGVDNAFGHALYYDCKVIDGEPKAEDGSTVHSLAKVLTQKGRLSKYAWASTVAAMQQWVTTEGPVVMGTDWDNDMFDPDANGFVKPGGGIAGGHCFLMVGYHADRDAFEFVNSWGTGWADGGHFFMKTADFSKLWHRSGNEAMVALELPL